jgi:hypothetical protein
MANVFQVTQHVRRIEAVEKDLKALRDTTVPKGDLARLRAEVKKLYDGLHVGTSLSARFTSPRYQESS